MPTGVCSVSFDRRDIAMNKFMASGMEGQHHVFEARTQHPSEVCAPALPDKHCHQPPQTLLFLEVGKAEQVPLQACPGVHAHCFNERYYWLN